MLNATYNYSGLTFFVILCACFSVSKGWVKFVDPPSARIGFTGILRDDGQNNCGGFEKQWKENNGNCGLCGNVYQRTDTLPRTLKLVRDNFIPIHTKSNQIDITLSYAANLGGYFEFKVCDVKRSYHETRRRCVHHQPVTISDVNSTRYFPETDRNTTRLRLRLTPNLTCERCLLQLKYRTGYRAYNKSNGCIDCGPQEEFYDCTLILLDRKQHFNRRRGQVTNPSLSGVVFGQEQPVSNRPLGTELNQYGVIKGSVPFSVNVNPESNVDISDGKITRVASLDTGKLSPLQSMSGNLTTNLNTTNVNFTKNTTSVTDFVVETTNVTNSENWTDSMIDLKDGRTNLVVNENATDQLYITFNISDAFSALSRPPVNINQASDVIVNKSHLTDQSSSIKNDTPDIGLSMPNFVPSSNLAFNSSADGVKSALGNYSVLEHIDNMYNLGNSETQTSTTSSPKTDIVIESNSKMTDFNVESTTNHPYTSENLSIYTNSDNIPITRIQIPQNITDPSVDNGSITVTHDAVALHSVTTPYPVTVRESSYKEKTSLSNYLSTADIRTDLDTTTLEVTTKSGYTTGTLYPSTKPIGSTTAETRDMKTTSPTHVYKSSTLMQSSQSPGLNTPTPSPSLRFDLRQSKTASDKYNVVDINNLLVVKPLQNISELEGKVDTYGGIPVKGTHHPVTPRKVTNSLVISNLYDVKNGKSDPKSFSMLPPYIRNLIKSAQNAAFTKAGIKNTMTEDASRSGIQPPSTTRKSLSSYSETITSSGVDSNQVFLNNSPPPPIVVPAQDRNSLNQISTSVSSESTPANITNAHRNAADLGDSIEIYRPKAFEMGLHNKGQYQHSKKQINIDTRNTSGPSSSKFQRSAVKKMSTSNQTTVTVGNVSAYNNKREPSSNTNVVWSVIGSQISDRLPPIVPLPTTLTTSDTHEIFSINFVGTERQQNGVAGNNKETVNSNDELKAVSSAKVKSSTVYKESGPKEDSKSSVDKTSKTQNQREWKAFPLGISSKSAPKDSVPPIIVPVVTGIPVDTGSKDREVSSISNKDQYDSSGAIHHKTNPLSTQFAVDVPPPPIFKNPSQSNPHAEQASKYNPSFMTTEIETEAIDSNGVSKSPQNTQPVVGSPDINTHSNNGPVTDNSKKTSIPDSDFMFMSSMFEKGSHTAKIKPDINSTKQQSGLQNNTESNAVPVLISLYSNEAIKTAIASDSTDWKLEDQDQNSSLVNIHQISSSNSPNISDLKHDYIPKVNFTNSGNQDALIANEQLFVPVNSNASNEQSLNMEKNVSNTVVENQASPEMNNSTFSVGPNSTNSTVTLNSSLLQTLEALLMELKKSMAAKEIKNLFTEPAASNTNDLSNFPVSAVNRSNNSPSNRKGESGSSASDFINDPGNRNSIKTTYKDTAPPERQTVESRSSQVATSRNQTNSGSAQTGPIVSENQVPLVGKGAARFMTDLPTEGTPTLSTVNTDTATNLFQTETSYPILSRIPSFEKSAVDQNNGMNLFPDRPKKWQMNTDTSSGAVQHQNYLSRLTPINTHDIKTSSGQLENLNKRIEQNVPETDTLSYPRVSLGLCRVGELFACQAVGEYSEIPGMVWWCFSHCKHGICPDNKCQCSCQPRTGDTDLLENGLSKKSKANTRFPIKPRHKKVINLTLNGTEEILEPISNGKRREKVAKVTGIAEISPHSITIRKTSQKISNFVCKGIGAFQNTVGIEIWCRHMCEISVCPEYLCYCQEI